MTVDVVLVVVRLAVGCWLLWSVRTVARYGIGSAAVDRSDVTVVIPARDEAASLPSLLGSLPDDVEVLVVDDHSADGTARVATAAGVRVLTADPLPEGWIGKAWACAQGAASSSAGTLVFVDADVRFAPGALGKLLALHRRRGGLLSVQPFHEPGTPTESLASIFNVVAYAATDAASPVGRLRGVRGAFGPVLITSRRDYAAVGGHDAVRDEVVEDVALADRYRRAGLPVEILAGGSAVRFRMYPEGLGQLIAGFSKNLAAGVGAVRRSTTLLVVAWSTLLIQAAAAPWLALASGRGLAGAVALHVVVAAQYWWMSRRLGRFGPVLALAFPVSVALFLWVFARSWWMALRGSATWRGRRVQTGRGRGTRR